MIVTSRSYSKWSRWRTKCRITRYCPKSSISSGSSYLMLQTPRYHGHYSLHVYCGSPEDSHPDNFWSILVVRFPRIKPWKIVQGKVSRTVLLTTKSQSDLTGCKMNPWEPGMLDKKHGGCPGPGFWFRLIGVEIYHTRRVSSVMEKSTSR